MDENKQHWMSAGLERFKNLEDKIFQVAEEVKTTRKEAEDLRGENGRLNEQLNANIKEKEVLAGEVGKLTQECAKLYGENDDLKKRIAVMRQTETETLEALAQFEKEREELRDRVEKTLKLLDSLDAR